MPEEQKVARKLTAILSADVKGYSLLMADDEVHTIQTLKAYRRVIADLISEYSGRVVDSPGDNILAELSSAVDAVKCAAKIQRKLAKENSKFVEEKKIQFRIGVNVGDVIQDGDRIYGNGVNIAARIEGLAEAGGVCISRNAYDHIRNKLNLGYEYLGEHNVKNIKHAVRVYKVLMDSETQKPFAEEQLEMPDKPSIAVLPFTNMSGDPSQEYFSDGLTEQIINGLCKVKDLFVIARNSSFAYKGKSINVQQVGKELGVRYVLEGSVQKAGDRVRITIQLIDTTTGYHIWSENYDRDLLDIFSLQDEITIKIMDAMLLKLTFGEQARLWAGATGNIQAFDKYMQALDFFYRLNEKDNRQAQHLFEEAIGLDNTFVWPLTMIGFTHMFEVIYRWSSSPIKSFQEAERCAEKALSLDDSFDVAHTLLGWIYLFKRQHERAIREGERAIELNPNGAEAHAQFALILCLSDETELAINLIKRAIRLNPIPPPHYYNFLAMAYRNNEQYEKAIRWSKKALSNNPDQLTAYITLVACYSSLNLSEKTRKAVEEVLRINPNLSLEHYANVIPYINKETADRFIGALRKAGLPE